MSKEKTTEEHRMKIKELAMRSGVSRYAIHYYLREGVLPPPEKTSLTTAFYNQHHLDCLRFIKKLREEKGLPIADVRQEVWVHFGDQWKKKTSNLSGNEKKSILHAKGNLQRQRIIEMAIDLFTSKGYHKTHVSHITDRLNISKGTFYLYFENKYDLLINVFDELIKELAKVEREIRKKEDPVVRLQERARAYFSFFEKYNKILDIVRAESIEQKSKPELNIHAIYRKILDHLADDIRYAREMGLLGDAAADPELVSSMMFGALDFVCYHQVASGKYKFEAVLECLTRLFMYGVMNRNLMPEAKPVAES